MKTSVYRRVRHRAHTNETARSKNEQQQEHSFFSDPTHDPFFKTSNGITAQSAVQLKPLDSANESIPIQRMEDKKEEKKMCRKKQQIRKKRIRFRKKRIKRKMKK